jgi:hypothetical protein
MNRYSTDLPPGAGKKVSEVTLHLNHSDLLSNPAMAPVLKLKPGQVSPIIDLPEGKAIYKLISVKNEAPADFAKNTKKYRDQYLQTRANEEVRMRMEKITKSDLIRFPLPGYKALHDYFNLLDPALLGDPAEYARRLRELADAAKAAATDSNNPGDDHAALLAWYAAVEDLWNRGKNDPKQADALRKERTETLQAVLQQSESFQARMDLVDLGIEAKDADMAAQNLLEAARMNNTYDTTGEMHFRDIQTRLARLKITKLVSAEQAGLIEKEQQRWREDKAANDKAEKEFKAQQEEEKKKQAAELKKFDEEQKKMAAETKKQKGSVAPNKTP